VPTIAMSNVARLDSAMPERVGAFSLQSRRRWPGISDIGYHYVDGSVANVSVYLYPVNGPGARDSGDARARVAREGVLLLDVLPIQVRRGIYDSFEPLVSRPDSFMVDGVAVPGYLIEARVHRGASAAHELQFLHLIGGDYVKLRATVPESWPIAPFRSLDSNIVVRLVHP
jgi:hypothetical protein